MALARCRNCLSLLALAAWACSDPPAKVAGPTTSAADADSSTNASDLTQLELGTSDTVPTSGACPGSPGCSCASAEECSTGVCADSAETATGKACAYPFGSGCAAGFVAFTATVGEGASVCVPAAPKLCNPCEKDDDCKALGTSGALCVDRGAAGRFCGVACPGGACSSGYVCADATSVSGAKAKQCQPSEQRVPSFSCPCSVAAIGLKLSTPCQVVNAVGACTGQRACGAGGLGACTGKVPAVETCDSADNDCNGQTDEGALCDDGSACTVGDGCVGGKCVAGVAKACDDKNPCTADACEPKSGDCAFLAVDGPKTCDDGDPCTDNDACAAGKCLAGAAKACDGGSCTIGQCDKTSGKCAFANKADGSGCDDGDPCTAGEVCGSGLCQGGKSQCQCQADGDCPDDGKVCNGVPYCDKSVAAWACKVNPGSVKVCPPTSDPCQVAQCSEPAGTCGTVNLPDGATCDDGKAWTVGDFCQQGACVPSLDTKLCKTTADCAAFEDGDLCNGTLFCNKATGVCQLNPTTVVYCPTADDTVCRKNLCGAKTGKCALTGISEGKACEDGNLCTTGEACQAGVCTASAAGDTCLCKQDSDCGKFEDGDACNGTLFCNLAKAKCALNPATIVQCPSAQDGPCAVNACDKATGLCAMKATVGKAACDADGSDCTPVDQCVAGKCVADTANVCACSKDTDCADDSNLCNGVPYCDKAKGVCKPNPATVVSCELAGDTTCTVTACDPGVGKCVKVTAGMACSDGDACTVGDVCAGGACKAGAYTCGACKGAGECDDGNACTDDSCSGQPLACGHKDNAATCNDGNACTTGDGCAGGKCAGKPLDCDDTEACTTDTCKGGGCVHLADSAATCTDSDACTVGDFCLGKACKAGQGKADCDDKLACTVDSCDYEKGCLHKDDVSLCDDKSVCTVDSCTAGKCGNVVQSCDDGNVCTVENCNPIKGCVVLPGGGTCTDGNACTVGDSCAGGACLPGAVTGCDDGNSCTADGCEPAKGCVAVKLADGVTCDDGNPCFVGEACAAGLCKFGTVAVCQTTGCTGANDGATCATGQGACENGHCVQTDAKGYKWTLVPAGKFWMGCNTSVETCGFYETPQHEVDLSAYWLGVYEVTVYDYKKCEAAGASGCTAPVVPAGGKYSTYDTGGKEQHPINYVNWNQAQAFCDWLGGALPTEAQWEKGARGGCELYAGKVCSSSELTFPWGNAQPTCGLQGVFADYNGETCGQALTTFPVGAGSAQGQSPYGAYDMVGNVTEWVKDMYLSYFYKTAEATKKDPWCANGEFARAVRGVAFSSNTYANFRAAYRDHYYAPLIAFYGLGLRCAKPMPETLCDNKDDNANGTTDEGCNDDSDLYCDATLTTVGTPVVCPKGGGDCDDKAASVNPGAAELCDGLDNNCNGKTDDACSCPDGTEAVDVSVAAGKKTVCSALWPVWGYLDVSRPASEFVISGDKATVADSKTGLVWQRDPPTTGGPSSNGTYDWAGAGKYCDDLVLGGADDWRLPSLAELLSITDRGKSYPAADGNVLPTPTIVSVDYWSRTPYQPLPSPDVWAVYFKLGNCYNLDATDSNRVRCVRGTTVPGVQGRFSVKTDASGDVVVDAALKRTWQRATAAGSYTWANAKTYCGGLQVQGGGWRLPDIRELESLVDVSATKPAIDKVSFPDTLNDSYWSVTLSAASASSAWSVYLTVGSALSIDIATTYRVRCIR